MKREDGLVKVDKKHCNILIYCILITLVFFGIFIKMDFATDTYWRFMNDSSSNFKSFCENGRALAGLWWVLISIVNLGDNFRYLISFVIAIIAIVFSIYKLYKIINKNIRNDLISILSSTIIIINPYSIELFFFVEKGMMCLSVLFSICAVQKFIEFLEDKNRKTIIFVIIYTLIATFCYQGTVGIFLLIGALYIMLYSKNIKEFVLNNVIMFGSYGLSMLLSLLSVSSNRVGGKIILKETILKVIYGIRDMLYTYGIWPKFMFSILILIIFIMFIIVVIRNKENKKTKLINIFSMIYISAVVSVVTILPVAVQSTNAIWFTARATYAFASLIGILLIYIIIINKNSLFINKLVIGIIVFILIIQFYRFNKIELDHYAMNCKDKEISLQIVDTIREYESTEGVNITKIDFYKDKNSTINYDYLDIFRSKNMNESAFYASWSNVNMVNYYNNTDFKRAEYNNEIDKIFKDKDYTKFSKDAIIFINDTAYICLW